jgi:hypothetical protein
MFRNYSYEIQCTNEEIFEIVDKSKHQEIISKDKNPLYKKFVVAHEGVSRPRLVGVGKSVLNWTKESIKKVHDLLTDNVYAIAGHTKDNSNSEGKKPLAYVVGKKLEQVGGKLRTVIALYFPDKERSNYDVISMEANGVQLDERNIVNDILSIPRLALGKSNEVQPAFEGAKLIGEYQFFEEIKEEKEKKYMSPRELKEIIQREGIHFSQLFDIKEVIGEPFKEPDGRITFIKGDDRVLAYINRVIPQPAELEKQLKEKEDLINKLSTEANNFKRELYKTNSKPILDKYTKERNLSEIQSKYLEKTFQTFEPNPEQDIEKQLDLWSQKQLESLKTVLELQSPNVENVPIVKESKETSSEKNYL